MLNKSLAIILVLCFLFISCNNKTGQENVSKDYTEKEKISKISSIEEAKQNAVGTWQWTKGQGKSGIDWDKVVIKDNGKFEYYTAFPRDGKWIFKNEGTWDAGTDRYENTGNRYYYVGINFKEYRSFTKTWNEYTFRLVYQDSKTLHSFNFSMGNNGMGEKTDKSPWD